ncbi:hypothetical protein HU200_005229 [Digitaria exilis]|uniref:RING-type E3 ubiquitin transferase n=1 Tax=Digitaria exilis TaxID=1010633 RepID=A0A835FTB6_9POAL|nr:hypothetical protein HU200_005229 [Digitaria exilis]
MGTWIFQGSLSSDASLRNPYLCSFAPPYVSEAHVTPDPPNTRLSSRSTATPLPTSVHPQYSIPPVSTRSHGGPARRSLPHLLPRKYLNAHEKKAPPHSPLSSEPASQPNGGHYWRCRTTKSGRLCCFAAAEKLRRPAPATRRDHMGAERSRRWKLLLPFRSLSLPPAASSKAKRRPLPDVPIPPSPARKETEEEVVPPEFLCPILRAPMADPVILPSGMTYERACVHAAVELGLSLRPDGVGAAGERNMPGGDGGAGVAGIPNDALRAAVRTWCARSGHAAPVAPSPEMAREAVLRAVPAAARAPPERAASNLSCSSEAALAPARSVSNLSSSSEGASAASTSSSSSSGRSSAEVVVVVRGKELLKDEEKEKESVVREGDAQEEEAVARAVERGDETEVESAMAALRRATRDGAARRRALCGPRLLAALRRVLLSSRHTASARADAAAALANLSLQPENRVPIVRSGAVPALVDAITATTSSSPAEACEHAAGALFGLALHDGNRAAIGVLGAVPPLLAVFSGAGDHATVPLRARRDAGMALYHLSLAAVNQSKLARAAGAPRTLLAIASDADEPSAIRRLTLMVVCNVAATAEGRAALMDAGAVATAAAILSDDGGSLEELREWCVAALYAMSKGSPRFRGLARAAGLDLPLMLIAEQASPGAHKDMAQAALRTVLGLADNNDDDDDKITECRSNNEGNNGGGRLPHRRRVASWSAPPPATPASAHQWRSVCID